MTHHFQYCQGYSIGVGGVVLHDQRVLLVRRASGPRTGDWALPGGYIERDETIDLAVKREVLEETGIAAEVDGLIGVLHRWVEDENGLYLMFLMHAVSGEPRADRIEVNEARFFTRRDLDDLPELQWLSRLIVAPVLQSIHIGLARCPIPDDVLITNGVLYRADK